MQILNCEQGSEAWQIERLNSFCASEAPMMMGVSKHMTRNQLLDLKKGWQKNPDKHFLKMLFEKGHESEAQAREITELHRCEDYPPVVGELEVEGMRMLASFDGLEGGTPGSLTFEHKLWNQVLAANVRNSLIGEDYYWQLEHQCLVNGNDAALFVCSDGGEENRVECLYHTVPDRRAALIAGWKQFDKDLSAHEIEAKVEIVTAQKTEEFPLVTYGVAGSLVSSNIADILPIIKQRAQVEMNRTLESDQDFANKENFNKSVVKARENLKDVGSRMAKEFVSLSEVTAIISEADSVLQQMQAHGEKQIKDEKEKRKGEIVSKAEDVLAKYAIECDMKITPLTLAHVCTMQMPDFKGAMRGKRSIDKMRDAVSSLVAAAKIDIDQVMARIVPNQIYLRANAESYKFLFADIQQIINQETEPFQAIVKQRISDHNEAEKVRLDGIQKEADRKATIKAENKVKGDALISAWQEAAHQCNESTDLETVRKLHAFLKDATNADLSIFAERSEEANNTRLSCLEVSENRIEALTAEVKPEIKEETEPTKTPAAKADPAQAEVVEPEVVEPEELAAEETPSTFVTDFAAWAKEYSIPQRAVNALGEIMRNHGV